LGKVRVWVRVDMIHIVNHYRFGSAEAAAVVAKAAYSIKILICETAIVLLC